MKTLGYIGVSTSTGQPAWSGRSRHNTTATWDSIESAKRALARRHGGPWEICEVSYGYVLKEVPGL